MVPCHDSPYARRENGEEVWTEVGLLVRQTNEAGSQGAHTPVGV
jgi:hypothetical protein